MRKTPLVCLFIAGILLGSIPGFFLGGGGARKEAGTPAAGGSAEAAEIARLRKRIDELLEEGAREKAAREEAAKAAAAATETEAPNAPPARKPSPAAAAAPYELASLDEAEGIYRQSMKKYDIQGLLDLAAVLLAMGEQGYDKGLELFEQMVKEAGDDKVWQALLGDEINAGRLLRAVADHHEGALRFALYLEEKDPETLGPTARKVQEELRRELRGELGSILLGYYGGDDPEIQAGYSELFKGGLEEESGRPRGRSVNAIAQLRTEESTDILLGLLEKDGGDLMAVLSIVRALWYQRNPRALPALRALRAKTEDEAQAALLDAAIRSME